MQLFHVLLMCCMGISDAESVTGMGVWGVVATNTWVSLYNTEKQKQREDMRVRRIHFDASNDY